MIQKPRMSRRIGAGAVSRRAFLLGAGTAAIAGCGGGKNDSDQTGNTGTGGVTPTDKTIVAGCYSPSYAGYSDSQIGCGILQSFGDTGFDSAFNQEIQIQRSFYQGITPSVYVFNECSDAQANSLSLPQGYLLIGYYCVRKVIAITGDALPAAGILAHEWAHQVQFAYGWMNTGAPTAAPVELEADAFSGLYMGYAKGWAGPELNAYLEGLAAFGDWNFGDPSHHGTPNQRAAAGVLGLQVAAEIMHQGLSLGYQDVHSIFVPQINQIMNTVQRINPDPGESAKRIERLDPNLTWPANAIAARLDPDFILDVAQGVRSAAEFTRIAPANRSSVNSPLYAD
jgi:hypothetical protein